mgnify:CR=1 FL=1|jgi:hypothetical protein
MKIISYLSDETIRKITDLIKQDIDNAIWLGLIKDHEILEGELGVEIKR